MGRNLISASQHYYHSIIIFKHGKEIISFASKQSRELDFFIEKSKYHSVFQGKDSVFES